jgi:hypothetical protein
MDEDMDDELAKALALSMETDEPLQVVTRTSFGVSLCGSFIAKRFHYALHESARSLSLC